MLQLRSMTQRPNEQVTSLGWICRDEQRSVTHCRRQAGGVGRPTGTASQVQQSV
jgi:hypothetical protein